jgi:HlyD family secretion protein
MPVSATPGRFPGSGSTGGPAHVASFLAALLALGLAACGDGAPAGLPGTLERDRLELTAQSADPLVELAVREGQAVAAGDLLARQDPSSLGAALAAAEGRATEARARLAEAEAGPRREAIARARARRASTQAALAQARRELARAEQLLAERLVAVASVDAARERRDLAIAAADEAGAALLELTSGTRPEQLAQARAAVAAAESEVARLRTDVARLTLRAPRSGTVEALPYRVGERPVPGAPVVVMLADDAPFARVYVPEPLRASLTPGATATVRVDGVDRTFDARLRYVAAQASFTPYFALNARDRSRLAYLAEFTLEGPDARRLPSGVPLEVTLTGAAAR